VTRSTTFSTRSGVDETKEKISSAIGVAVSIDGREISELMNALKNFIAKDKKKIRMDNEVSCKSYDFDLFICEFCDDKVVMTLFALSVEYFREIIRGWVWNTTQEYMDL